MREPYLLLGTVVKPQGLHGEVKLHHETGDPERFYDLQSVYLRQGDAYTPIAVLGARLSGEEVFLTFQGVDDRDAAEKLRGQALYIDRANARPLRKNEVFIADLLGIHATDTDGHEIGTVKDVLQNGGTDVLVFATPRGPLMAPFLKRLVVELDVTEGRMVLDKLALSEVALYENSDSDHLPGDV
jgi:16S rRNA processing protein RimM